MVQIPHLADFSGFKTSLCSTAFCLGAALALGVAAFLQEELLAPQGEGCSRNTGNDPLCPGLTLVLLPDRVGLGGEGGGASPRRDFEPNPGTLREHCWRCGWHWRY